jgi:hypothetical protein
MLRLELHAGWLDCTFAAIDPPVVITASYLSDAPEDLAAAVVALLRGAPTASATWAEEPGEHRWRFTRLDAEQVRVCVYAFPRLWGTRPDEEGEVLVDVRVRLRTFAGALLAELQRWERELGEAGYAEAWGEYPFPTPRLRQLRQLLDAGAGRTAHAAS